MAIQNIVCPNCSTAIERDASFCANCGLALENFSIASSNDMVTQEFNQLSESHGSNNGTTATHTTKVNTSSQPLQQQSVLLEDIQEAPVILSKHEIQETLQKLQSLSTKIEDYFPAQLPGKERKLYEWKQQIARAQSCLNLLENQLLQDTMIAHELDQYTSLSEAVSALDFTREYTVKLIGQAGAGKSTLLTALIGRDILPTGFGTAVTGIRTRIYICNDQQQEMLHIQFLSRDSFEQLFVETEKKKDEEEFRASQSKRKTFANNGDTHSKEEIGPYTKEWQRLKYLKEHGPDKSSKKTYADMYLDETRHIDIPEAKWKSEGRRFIIEPNKDDEPYLVRLVDSAQFDIHTNQYTLLPEGSLMVDLPGSAAGKVSHDAILREELRHLDAIILVATGPRYDNENARTIFDQVRQVIWNKNRSSEVAARMVFTIATRWDEIKNEPDRESAVAGMDALLKKLPATYEKYHTQKPKIQGNYAFYPISAFDARMAMLGLEKTPLDSNQQDETRDYKGHITKFYDELRKLDSSLPLNFIDTEFKDYPHQAMLQRSGLPELRDDLGHFLAEQRYEVQLQHAKERLDEAFQNIENVCWAYLRQQGFTSRDLQKLRRENARRADKRKDKQSERIQDRIDTMRHAWDNAIKEFDKARIRGRSSNSFYQALRASYDQAISYMYRRIDNKEFDPFIDIDNDSSSFSWIIDPKEGFTDIAGKNLRSELRSKLWLALEQRLDSPSQILAGMFLTPIERQGTGTDGALDIKHVSFQIEDEKLNEITHAFNELLEQIRSLAYDICRYVTMSELLDDETHLLPKDHPLMVALYKLGDIAVAQAIDQLQLSENIKTSEEVLDAAREIMKRMVVALSDGLIESSYRRVAFIYRSELDKLDHHTTYDMLDPDKAPQRSPGAFTDMINSLSRYMQWLLINSSELSAKIDGTIPEEIDFSIWADFIEKLRKQKKELHVV